jgi:hypothetical protein
MSVYHIKEKGGPWEGNTCGQRVYLDLSVYHIKEKGESMERECMWIGGLFRSV